MDVSPKTLREVEFREKMRGYHPEDVDQFLERVAAGIEVLQDRLRQALERAQRAEGQLSEAGGTDEALRRTLVLAQRTADLAVQEAREQAARILAGAEQQAQAVLAEAEDRAHRAHEDALAEAQAELARLDTSRQQLELDVETLLRWVEEHKVHLASALRDSLARIEGTELLSAPPATLTVDLTGGRPSSFAPPATAAPALAPQPLADDADGEGVGGPPTMAWRPDDQEGDEATRDPYFVELRRAVNDHEPLGPREEERYEEEGHNVPAGVAAAGTSEQGDEFFDQDFADNRRFGGRLRRRR
jgi:cell division initiation protein